jgi:hypothetical protein
MSMDAKTLSEEDLAELKRLREKAVDAERKLATYDGEDGCAEYRGIYLQATNTRSTYLGLLQSLAPALIAAAERERWIPVAERLPEIGCNVAFEYVEYVEQLAPSIGYGRRVDESNWLDTVRRDREGDMEYVSAGDVLRWRYVIPPAPGAQT